MSSPSAKASSYSCSLSFHSNMVTNFPKHHAKHIKTHTSLIFLQKIIKKNFIVCGRGLYACTEQSGHELYVLFSASSQFVTRHNVYSGDSATSRGLTWSLARTNMTPALGCAEQKYWSRTIATNHLRLRLSHTNPRD